MDKYMELCGHGGYMERILPDLDEAMKIWEEKGIFGLPEIYALPPKSPEAGAKVHTIPEEVR